MRAPVTFAGVNSGGAATFDALQVVQVMEHHSDLHKCYVVFDGGDDGAVMVHASHDEALAKIATAIRKYRREEIAAGAMRGILSNPDISERCFLAKGSGPMPAVDALINLRETVRDMAIDHADALLAELEKGGRGGD